MFWNNEEMTKGTVGAQPCSVNASPGKVGLLLATCLLYLATAPAALADNECDPVGVDPAVSPGADTFTCDQDSYPSVTYTADGDLTLDVVGGGGSRVDITDGDSATDGFSLTGTGTGADAESLTFNSVLEIQDNHSDVVLDFATETGDITLNLDDDIDPGNSATHAVRAVSTGTGAGDGGDIAVTVDGIIQDGATTGLEAASAGGDITIAVDGNAGVRGDEFGIRADTSSGDGEMLLDIHSRGGFGFAVEGDDAGIVATSGSGPMVIDVHGEVNTASGFRASPTGTAIRTDAGGDAVINLFEADTALPEKEETVFFGDGEYAVDMTAAAGTTTTLNVGRLLGTRPGGSRAAGTIPEPVLRGAGAGRIVVNLDNAATGRLWGGADFSGNSGGVTVNNLADAGGGTSGGWAFGNDAVTFGSGDDTVNNASLLRPNSGFSPRGRSGGTDVPNDFRQSTMAFGAGRDEFRNTGVVVLGEGQISFSVTTNSVPDIGSPKPLKTSRSVASETTFQDLEEFHNAGLIVLGGWVANASDNEPSFYVGDIDPTGEAFCRKFLVGDGLVNPPPDGFPCSATQLRDTDRLPNDVLALPGTAFTGSGASRILLDVVFNRGLPQTKCHAGDNDREGEEGIFSLPGADCVDLRGGSTAGNTRLIVRDRLPGEHGAHNPEGLVLVDVGGGSSSADAFTLSPASDHYATTADGRGVIDKGLLMYPLIYDADTLQHKLVGMPSGRALQMPLLGQAVHEAARRSAAGSRGRTAALHSGDAPKGGFWGDLGHATAERDARQTLVALGEEFAFNNDFEQDTTTLNLGLDFVPGDGAWYMGGSLGYVRSRLTFDRSASRSDLDGALLGVYGGYRAGAFHVDSSLQHGWWQVDYNDPVFSGELAVNRIVEGGGEGTNSQDTDARSLAARVEAGWRLDLSEALYLQPLAGLSWVRADFDDLEVSAVDTSRPENRNAAAFDNPTSFRGGLGARLGLDTTVAGLVLRYNLTGQVWNEFDGESDVTIESAGPDATVSDEFDGTFTEIRAGVDLSNASGSLSGFLSADGTFHEDYDSVGAEIGFRYQW